MRQSSQPVPALQHGLTILEMIAESENPVSFSEIFDAIDASKATVARLLSALRQRGYIARQETSGRYIRGPRLLRLIEPSPLIERLHDASDEILQRLTAETGNTSLCLYWDNHRLHCVNKSVAEHSVALQEVGRITRDLSHCPWGWVAYADCDPTHQAAARENMKNPARAAALKVHLEQYLKDGYALDDREVYPSLRRFAAPVRDARGRLIGVLGLGGFVGDVPDENVDEIGSKLRGASDELSRRLGA